MMQTTSRASWTPTGQTALAEATYEYCLVTAPVAIYVTLEALHKHELSFLITSPEWAIATIFHVFQGMALYIQNLRRTGRKLSNVLYLLGMGGLLVVIFAAINAFASLGHNTASATTLRLLLFGLSSISFFALVTGSKILVLESTTRSSDD